MQTCLGGIYAWSTFVPPLHSEHGLSNAQTQLIFGLTMATFTVGMVFAGRLQDRHGPRLVALVGGVLFGAGYLVAASSGGVFSLLLLGLAIIAGIGIPFGYICALATCIKWFPRRQGLVTGISVAGYGAGAILLSSLATYLLGRGMTVLEVFYWIGLVYGTVVIAAALLLEVPPEAGEVSEQATVQLGKLLRQREFWALVLGMFAGSFAGVVVIGNLKPIGLAGGLGETVATASISTLAVGNAASRICWGAILDRLGRATIVISLVFVGLAVLTVLVSGSVATAFLLVALLVGFGYGACPVIYAARVATVWGAPAVGTVYPIVLLFHGLAAITGPYLCGAMYDATGAFVAPLLVAGTVGLAGALGTWWLRPVLAETKAS